MSIYRDETSLAHQSIIEQGESWDSINPEYVATYADAESVQDGIGHCTVHSKYHA